MVSDSADPAMPASSSAHTIPAGLEDDAICEVHLESDFATLHSSTPGKRFLETVALPEGRPGEDSHSRCHGSPPHLLLLLRAGYWGSPPSGDRLGIAPTASGKRQCPPMPGYNAAPGHPHIPLSDSTRAQGCVPLPGCLPLPCLGSSPPHQLCLHSSPSQSISPQWLVGGIIFSCWVTDGSRPCQPGSWHCWEHGIAERLEENTSLLSSLKGPVLFPCCGFNGPNIMISEKMPISCSSTQRSSLLQ